MTSKQPSVAVATEGTEYETESDNGLCPYMEECYEVLGLTWQDCRWNVDNPPTWQHCGGIKTKGWKREDEE
jgi:hypothetical protein